MKVIADFREQKAGLIEMLFDRGIDVQLKHLACGDYLIDGQITVERKTAADFVLSIIDGRLFRQAALLKRNAVRPTMVIEGNPFYTSHAVDRSAVQGALLSLQILWYLPVIFARSIEDTVQVFQIVGRQVEKSLDVIPLRCGYRPRRLATRQLHILQGLPGVGPHLAKRMLRHFGSVSAVLAASHEEIKQVRGVGNSTAENIRSVLDSPWRPS